MSEKYECIEMKTGLIANECLTEDKYHVVQSIYEKKSNTHTHTQNEISNDTCMGYPAA